jgi:hypothetical protein
MTPCSSPHTETIGLAYMLFLPRNAPCRITALFNSTRRVTLSVSWILLCADDEDAKEQAVQQCGGEVEVWQLDRMVAVVRNKTKSQ